MEHCSWLVPLPNWLAPLPTSLMSRIFTVYFICVLICVHFHYCATYCQPDSQSFHLIFGAMQPNTSKGFIRYGLIYCTFIRNFLFGVRLNNHFFRNYLICNRLSGNALAWIPLYNMDYVNQNAHPIDYQLVVKSYKKYYVNQKSRARKKVY